MQISKSNERYIVPIARYVFSEETNEYMIDFMIFGESMGIL